MRVISIFQVLITTSLLVVVQSKLKVTQLQVLFRHGDRTPSIDEIYPNDIHNISAYEPWGLGQLTNTGKMRAYEIGQVLKTRYQNLLSSRDLPSAVFALSTDVDRTKASLQLVLAGLFPPSKEEVWNSKLPWIPVPTYYVPVPLDVVMKADSCPEYIEALSKVRKLPEIQARVAVHSELYNFLTEKTGQTITGPSTVQNVYHLIVAQKALNLTLPDWCTDELFQEMAELTIFEHDTRSHTLELRRKYGGPLVKKMIDKMNLDRDQEDPRKLYLYSAHDVNILAFLKAQGINEPKLPNYGTAVMFEKLVDTEGKIFVRIVLWTGVTRQLITLRLPGCEEVCPIEKYLELTKDVIPFNEELDCLWTRLTIEEFRNILSSDVTYYN